MYVKQAGGMTGHITLHSLLFHRNPELTGVIPVLNIVGRVGLNLHAAGLIVALRDQRDQLFNCTVRMTSAPKLRDLTAGEFNIYDRIIRRTGEGFLTLRADECQTAPFRAPPTAASGHPSTGTPCQRAYPFRHIPH